jgi:hypothetical protein
MRSNPLERWGPGSGILFAICLTVLFVLSGSPPGASDKTVDVVRYWNDNDSKQIIASLFGGLAVAFFIWFAGSLRSMFRSREGGTGRLSAISYGGGLIFAAGGAIATAITFAAADTAGDVPPQVTQTLSVMNADFFVPFAASILVFQAANAALILSYGGLPRWLGYFSILVAVISITPAGFLGLPLMIVWVLIAAIAMLMREPDADAATPGPAATT